MVPEAGLEPAQAFTRGILSPLRLPIPPLRRPVYCKSLHADLASREIKKPAADPECLRVTGRFFRIFSPETASQRRLPVRYYCGGRETGISEGRRVGTAIPPGVPIPPGPPTTPGRPCPPCPPAPLLTLRASLIRDMRYMR